jgi:hypothetical protein
VTAWFAFAVPFADFSVATDEACSGSAMVAAVPVRSAETEALAATDALGFPSFVAAPATCARSTTTARTAAVSQIGRCFMCGSFSEPEGPREYALTHG